MGVSTEVVGSFDSTHGHSIKPQEGTSQWEPGNPGLWEGSRPGQGPLWPWKASCGTWHSQWEGSALVQNHHPLSRAGVGSTDIPGFSDKWAMRKLGGTWELEGKDRGTVIPTSESSWEKKQTREKRLLPTFVETPNEDTVALLCCHLLSLASAAGTVLSALYINYHVWSYQRCWI